MMQSETSDRMEARKMLVMLANTGRITTSTALELAAMLCDLAGGDGRGVYSIVHDPTGDRTR